MARDDQAEFDVPPNGAAQRLIDDPLVTEILASLETEATERALDTRPDQEPDRALARCEVQAIRALREQLKTLAKGKTKRPGKRRVI